jgi:RHS repeat-associated protein
MGRLIQQTDPLGHNLRYGYDLRGRLSSETDPLSYSTLFQYSAAGNLVTVIDPMQRTISYGYDAADQLKTIAYRDGLTPNVAFTYDAGGRRTSMQDGSGTSRYGYDTLSRLITSSDGAGQSIAYGYDANSNLKSITYPGGFVVNRGYDDANHLSSVSDWLYNTSSFGYDADGNLIHEALPNTVASTYAYDPAGRLQVIDASNAGTGRFMRFTYTRDAVGNITAQSEQLSQGGIQKVISTTNSYDVLNRLTAVTSGKATYDNADNLTARSAGSASVTSSYNAARELEAETVSTSAGTSSYTFSYDANGNRVQRATVGGPALGYTYDQANRLTQLSTTTYAYNGDGLRISKTYGGGPAQHFTWELGDGAPVLIQDASATYVTGPGGRPIEQIMPDGTVFYVVPDELGSTEALTNGSGQPVTEYAYPDPYGAVTLSQPGTPQTPFQYAGQYSDAESGQQYLESRYYDPLSGDFLTRDPAASLTRQPYTYAGDSPFNAAGLGAQLSSLSGTPEPPPSLEQQVRQVAAASVQAFGDFLGETHDDLVSADPLHVTVGVANSFLIALGIMDAAAGVASIGRAVLPRLALEAETGGAMTLRSLGAASADDPAIGPAFRADIQLFGGRGGGAVKDLVGPPNSLVRGAEGRIYQTNAQGNVIADITAGRVKPVEPGVGFGPKRAPTQEELDWLDALWPSQ